MSEQFKIVSLKLLENEYLNQVITNNSRTNELILEIYKDIKILKYISKELKEYLINRIIKIDYNDDN